MMSSKPAGKVLVPEPIDTLVKKLGDETGSLKGGLDALEGGRGFAWKQALVQCAIVLLKAKGKLDASTLIYVAFWALFSAWGYFMFTPGKPGMAVRVGFPDLKTIIPKLAIYIVTAIILVAVVSARSFTAIDTDPDLKDAELVAKAVPQLVLVIQVLVLGVPIYYGLIAFVRLQVEAMWLALKSPAV